MSEQEAKKYTSIRVLRDEIRWDMEDYKLLWTDEYIGVDAGTLYLFRTEDNDLRLWFSQYLSKEIDNNLLKLKELGEQNNE